MGYITSSILFFVALLAKKNTKDWSNPITLYCIGWSIICFMSALQLFGIYKPSFKTWMIIFVGSIGYLLGALMGKKVRIGQYRKRNLRNDIFIPIMSEKMFWGIVVFIYIISIPDVISSIQSLLNGDNLAKIRLDLFGLTGENPTNGIGIITSIMFYVTLCKNALIIIVIATGINAFFENMVRYKINLFAVSGLVIISTITTGGRFALAYFIIELFACYCLYKKKGNLSKVQITKKSKLRVIGIIIAFIIVIIITSLLRGIEINGFVSQMYQYICGNIILLDTFVGHIDKSVYWSFPYAGFYGLWILILPLIRFLGIPYPGRYVATQNIVMIAQNWTRVGENLYMNAFVTPFYYLYADLRWIGVFGGMFLFGFIAQNMYKRMHMNLQGRDIVIYLLIVQMIFKTVQQYPFSSEVYVMLMLILIITSRSIKRKRIIIQ